MSFKNWKSGHMAATKTRTVLGLVSISLVAQKSSCINGRSDSM